MRAPRWARVLLRWVSPRGQAEDVLGDLEEAHLNRTQRHGPGAARVLTTVETLDMAAALVRERVAGAGTNRGSSMWQDYKLGIRMLVKYPGLTIAGGLALAIAIGIGAGWYDFSGDLFRPKLPLPGGDRIVEVEMRDAANSLDEQRLLHDFTAWRQELRLIEELGAYRTLERNLILGDARPEPVTVAEITASAFRVAAVTPLLGRPLRDADEHPGAPPVVVLGHGVWKQRFGGRADAIGQTVQLGRDRTTVVGVMPDGFAFPVNHRLWIPMQLKTSSYEPLEGAPIRIFGRLVPGATQAQAYAEVTTLAERTAAASPQTHQHLRPRVLAYGGESPGDKSLLEFVVRHLPILLVLVVACMNVATLIYARTATRDAEIAVRYALGASRGRIVGQLFVEGLVLATVAAIIGLAGANFALKWGVAAYYSGQTGAVPFWINPGLKLTTVLFAAGLTVVCAALLSVLPALKVTGTRVQSQLRNLGAGGSTLRFGGVWTTVMIAQVALTVICIPPAMGISHEAMRDRAIRDAFPAENYLAARVDLERSSVHESSADFEVRLERIYGELERRLAQEPGVAAVTFGDRLPGMQPGVRSAEVETAPETAPLSVGNMWTSAAGPRFFESFEAPLLAGRGFHEGDRATGARTVIVNQAFSRRYLAGANPVGRRVRWASAHPATPEPWFEIVGMVRDIGMTPTDLGEAPYVYHAVSPATAHPLVMGILMTGGDAAALTPRLRTIAIGLDAGLRLDDVRTLDELAWRLDVPQMVGAGAIVGVVSLGLFLSAAGIFSLMSVSVSRRTKEIGLRAALGATPARLIAGIFSRAIVLIGSGIAAGNALLMLFISLEPEVSVAAVWDALLITSAVILTVGLLACLGPARRALRIHPTDALREA